MYAHTPSLLKDMPIMHGNLSDRVTAPSRFRIISFIISYHVIVTTATPFPRIFSVPVDDIFLDKTAFSP
jgi:hypothetical protein